jgi:hypothetical protein
MIIDADINYIGCRKLALLGENGDDFILEVPVGITIETGNRIIGMFLHVSLTMF